jgi:N6-adenosine-specific RNA methylase IME4
VFVWTTQKFLPLTHSLIESFGARYGFTMTWHKSGGFQPIDQPQYNSEFVVYGRIGSPLFVDTKNFSTCFATPRREHSRKPQEFYDTVRRVTAGSRIDIFAREQRDGFATYGDETGKFSAPAPPPAAAEPPAQSEAAPARAARSDWDDLDIPDFLSRPRTRGTP